MYTYGDTLSQAEIKRGTLLLGTEGYYIWEIVSRSDNRVMLRAHERLRDDPYPEGFKEEPSCSIDFLLSQNMRLAYKEVCIFDNA